MTRSLLVSTVAILAGALMSGCLRAHAKTASDAPPLTMPPPPPRVIETVEAVPPPPVPLVEEPARQPIRAPERPQPPRVESAPRPTEPPKAEPDPSAVTEAPPPRPPATLQTTPPGAEAELERQIRTVLARATADLSRVNYQRLSQGGRSQYDTAKRFIQQSEEALRPPRKLEFAGNLADKAAALAEQLAGR